MAKESILKPAGLYTFPNVFSEVPPGALQDAVNVVIDQPSVISSRRGFDTYSDFGATATQADALVSYQDHLVASVKTTGNGKLEYLDDMNVFQQYPGDFEVPDPDNPASRIQFVEANKNLYFTTQNGIWKLDQYVGPAIQAGAPRALGGTGVTTGVTGFLPDQTNVAYRVVWGYKDANDNLILGAPSQRIIVSNTSGTSANVSLSFQIPAVVDETWFYQVYRSATSVDLSTPPDDELQQVYEDNPTTGEISAGEVTVTDSTPDDLRQAALYTNPSQESIQNANFEPPFAQDVTLYKGCVIYGNTKAKFNLDFTLIAAGAPDGLQVGDTITFTENSPGSGTFTLTGAVSEDASSNEFQIFDSGSPSENITNTANSLVSVLNRVTDNTFLDAYYTSGFDELPGKMELVAQTFSSSGFYVTSDRGAAFTPIVPSAATTFQAEADVAPNRIFYSKVQQPEAVPLYRYFDVGSAAFPIERVVALRDSVIILKKDGVFRLYGPDAESLSLATLDNTVRISARNSVRLLVNQAIFFCDQGIVAASDTGVKVLSRPIENTLLQLSSSVYPFFGSATHATSYESDRKYILWTVTEPEDEHATQAFVYNVFTDSWTSWDLSPTVGYVNPTDDKLYLGYHSATGNAQLARERKTYTRLDYADDSFEVSIASVGTDTVTLTDATGVVAGMTLVQGLLEAVIEDVAGDVLTLSVSGLAWDTDEAATVFTPIQTSIVTIPITGRAPLGMKHYNELNLVFSDASFTDIGVSFSSDLVPAEQEVTLLTNPSLAAVQRIRTYVPRNYTRANFIQLKFQLAQAFTSFGLNGFGLEEIATLTRFK